MPFHLLGGDGDCLLGCLIDWAYCEVWAFGRGEHACATNHHEVSVFEQMCTDESVMAATTSCCVIIMRCLRWVNVGREFPIFLGEFFQVCGYLRLDTLTVALLTPAKSRDLWSRFII